MNKKKVYKGARLNNDSTRVTVNGKCLKHHIKHSPTGYEWGYCGSGPADLARCILINYFNGTKTSADMYYQKFKFDLIAGWGDVWEITSEEISKWLSYRK